MDQFQKTSDQGWKVRRTKKTAISGTSFPEGPAVRSVPEIELGQNQPSSASRFIIRGISQGDRHLLDP